MMQKITIKPRSDIKIQNTVCIADLKEEINLKSFNKYKHLGANLKLYRFGYVKYNTWQAESLFRTGKLISMGHKSQSHKKGITQNIQNTTRIQICQTHKSYLR